MTDGSGRAQELVAGAMARRERLRTAMDELERSVAAAASGPDWPVRVRGAVERLTSVWQEHVGETEADDGPFDDIVEHAPRLRHTIDKLRRDHDEVPDALGRITTLIADRAEPEAIRSEATALFTRLASHRQVGADLLYEAFTVDLGAGD